MTSPGQGRRLPVKAYRDVDFLTSPKARTLRILAEYLEPEARFEREGVDKTVVFFGSARARCEQDAGGRSVGLNISLPHEQDPNPYITEELNVEFHYFFMRKLWFVQMAVGLVVFPGGFGTLDELAEVLTLIQTGRSQPKPIIVYGSEFWDDVIDFDALLRWGTISPEDLGLFHRCDTPEEAFACLKEHLVPLLEEDSVSG